MNYFVLGCMAGTGPLHFKLEVDWDNKGCWQMGRMFSRDDEDSDFHPPSGIIELHTKIDSKVRERIYPELSWRPLPLMSRRLVAALQGGGVDNLQLYETRLTNSQGEPPVQENLYLAVNIVGLVAAADLAESETNPEVKEKLISMDFQSLSIHPMRTHNALMFRLAENVSAVLVHERVKNLIESKGINTLTWYEPESWAG